VFVTAPSSLYDPTFTFKLGDNPKQPAVTMSQFAAKQYTKWLSGITGQTFRLPTEAEWEYACRAGTKGDYSFGDETKSLGSHAWFSDNSGKKTHPVGQKKANPWGLFDMHGNVAEWCNDVFDHAYYKSSPDKNPRGPADGKDNVLRGGSWKSSADALRSAYRLGETPGFSDACLARAGQRRGGAQAPKQRAPNERRSTPR